jgi:hypothetical protein
MSRRCRPLLRAAVLVAIAGLALPGAVHAVSLTNWNVAELNGSGDHVEVTIGSSGGNTTLLVEWVSGGLNGLTALGIDQFLFNATGIVDAVTTGPPAGQHPASGPYAIAATPGSWSLYFDGTEGDGFGDFNSHRNSDGGGTSLSVLFTLNGIAPSFFENSQGATFAAHVRYGDDCSGWVSDGTSNDVGSSSACSGTPPRQVAEPSTLLLIGGGFIGLGALIGRLRSRPRA